MARALKKLTVFNFADLCANANAPPILKSAAASIAFTERGDNASGENAFVHTATSKIRFADFNPGDRHQATFVPCGPSYLGTFSLGAVNQTANTVSWSIKVGDGALDYLQAGQTLIQKYKVTISDGHGGSVTQTITVKLTGTNDAPIITSPAQGATITELTSADPLENLLTHERGGTITFTDVDLLDTHTAAVTPQGSGYLGTFTLAPVNQGANSIGWSFTVPDSVLDALDPGQTLTQTYNVVINDGHGGTATQNVTVTIIGTQDPPGVTDTLSSLTVYEAALDEVKDGADIAAGDTTGTTPAQTSETDADVNGLTFTAGSAAIQSIVFADPNDTLDAFADPAFANLASGTPQWSLLAGGRLLVLSFSGQAALMVSLTGATTVAANSSGAVTVTATLTDAVDHLLPPSLLDVILSGLRVVATDQAGGTAAGSVTVTIVDDAPSGFEPAAVCVPGDAYATATAALDSDANIDPNFGADGGTIAFPASLDGMDSGLTSGGQPIVYALLNATTLAGKVGTANVFTVTLNPDGGAGLASDTYTVTMGPYASIDAPKTEDDCEEDSYDGVNEAGYASQPSSDDAGACAGDEEGNSYGSTSSQAYDTPPSGQEACEQATCGDDSEPCGSGYDDDDCIVLAPCCDASGTLVQIVIPVHIVDGDGDAVTAALPITFKAGEDPDDTHCDDEASCSSSSETSCSSTYGPAETCDDVSGYAALDTDTCSSGPYAAAQQTYASSPNMPELYC